MSAMDIQASSGSTFPGSNSLRTDPASSSLATAKRSTFAPTNPVTPASPWRAEGSLLAALTSTKSSRWGHVGAGCVPLQRAQGPYTPFFGLNGVEPERSPQTLELVFAAVGEGAVGS